MNLATGRATVVFDPGQVGVEDLVAAVDRIGHGLAPAEAEAVDAEAALQAMWLRRVLVAWPLGLTVLVLALFFFAAEKVWNPGPDSDKDRRGPGRPPPRRIRHVPELDLTVTFVTSKVMVSRDRGARWERP